MILNKYFRFIFQNVLYVFNCLPFGLCTAPFVFTKLLKRILAVVQRQGLRSLTYLDNILCFGSTYIHINCLPFGLYTAPFVFTEVLKRILAVVRRPGLRSVTYLNDILCFSSTHTESYNNLQTTIEILQCFRVHN